MKKPLLLTLVVLIVGSLQGFSQDYDSFQTEMKKLEKEEKEHHSIIFDRQNKYTDEQKEVAMPKMKAVREHKVELSRKSIQNNPDDGRFVDVLNFYLFNFLSIEELDKTLDHFTENARKNKMWKTMKSYVTYKPLNEVGNKSFDFTVKGHNNEDITLSDVLKDNKLVLLDFWASWCGPCRATMPHLKEVYKTYKDKGFEVFSVSLDDKEDLWKQAYETLDLPWIDGSNALGWEDPIAEKYAIRGIPHKVLVAQDGTIIGIGLNGKNELEETLEKYLNK